MRSLLAIVLLSGCASKPIQNTPIPTSESAELHAVWEKEVDDATAGLTAIRTSLKGPDSAIRLYDAQLQGLVSLAGQPSHAAVKAKLDLISLADPKALASLEAAKKALDAKTDALEAKARLAEQEALRARSREEEARKSAIQAEAASNLSRVAVLAIGAGILAFLFGHYLAIPKWVAASTVGLGVLVATTAPQLLAFFGSDNAQYLMLATFAAFAIGGVLAAALWVWRTMNPDPDKEHAAQKPQEGEDPGEKTGPREG